MARSVLPLVAIGGAAAFLLMPKKKKKTAKKNGNGSSGDPNISKTGTLHGWKYRVRKANTMSGFADQYFGEIQAPDSQEWIKAHQDGRTDPEAARLLAMEAIATRTAEQDTPSEQDLIENEGEYSGYKWRVLRTVPMEGFGTGYFGEIQAPDSQDWTRVHKDARTDPEQARLLALEAIALKLDESGS